MNSDNNYIVRFTLNERIQHFLLFISITLLLISGFALKYADTSFGQFFIRLEGGFQARGIIHRIGAVILIFVTFYHFIYVLFTKRGQEQFREMFLTVKDWTDFKQSLSYRLGSTNEPPLYGRYSYRQKLQYWLVAIATFSMEITGLMLWFHNESIAILSHHILNIVYVIHSYESTLIFTLIVIWHLYDIHIASHFPMDPVWLTGKISIKRLKKEHPLEYFKLFGREGKK